MAKSAEGGTGGRTWKRLGGRRLHAVWVSAEQIEDLARQPVPTRTTGIGSVVDARWCGALAQGNDLRGEVATQMSEHMARGYYKRWESYMNGADWDELLGLRDPRFATV